MKDEGGIYAENRVRFCTRPWRGLGAAVAALMAITFVWGGIILGTYQEDDRFGDNRSLSVTEFMVRNVALPAGMSLPDVIMPTVVGIEGGQVNEGVVASGAIVGAKGYVLTTLHSIQDLSSITVRVRTIDGIRSFDAQLVKKAPAHDLVLLKLRSPGDFLYLSLADTGTGPGGGGVLANGGSVWAFGQTGQGTPLVRQGALGDRPVQLPVEGQVITHLRTSDAIYSWEQNGGPVIDANGALVGITLAVQDTGGATRGYVVPADVIDSHFQDVVSFVVSDAGAGATGRGAGGGGGTGTGGGTGPGATGPASAPVAPALTAAPAAPPANLTGASAWDVAGSAGGGGPAAAMAPANGQAPGDAKGPSGAASWWIRAANQVAATGQARGVDAGTGVGSGPPIGGPAMTGGDSVGGSGPNARGGDDVGGHDADHLLGTRIAGFSIEDLIGLLALAIVKGVIGGMMTMGGGVFLVAGMIMFFGYGLFLIRPVAYLTNIFVYSASTLKHHRNGLIKWDTVKSLAPWAVIGVVIGYFIGNAIADRLVEVLLGIFAGVIAIKSAHEVLVREGDEILISPNGTGAGREQAGQERMDMFDASGGRGSVDDDDDDPAPSRARGLDIENLGRSALLALPMGIISGILGITGGVVEVPLQHYIGKVPLKNAIANSAALVFCASLTGTILSFVHGINTGLIDWAAPLALAGILIPASFIGGIVGAHLTKLAPKRWLKALFSVLMLAVAVRMFLGH